MSHRSYLGTLFNNGDWTEEEFNSGKMFVFDENNMHTLCGQIERCPKTQKLHWQFFIKFKGKHRIPGATKLLGFTGCNLTPHTYGKEEDMAKYTQKSETSIPGTFFKYGNDVKQGSRTELMDLKKKLEEGEKLDDLFMKDETFNDVAKSYRTLSRVEDLLMRKKFRNFETKGIWYYGPTGVGKSHKAFEGFHPDTHYVLNVNDNGWWEGYTQQETVIINDFRGEIKYATLLNLVDKYPFTVPRRGREPMPFLSKTVIITSSKCPEDIYSNILSNVESLKQLERRFEIVPMSRCSKE